MNDIIKQIPVMSAIKQCCQHALSIILLGFLFFSLIPYNFFLLCWMPISYLLPEPWFQKLDDLLWGWFQRLVVFVFEHYSGVEIMLDGDIPVIEENSIVISNHQSTLDWVVADFVAVRQNAAGHVRYVFKDSLKYLPLCGFPFAKHGGVFVKRDGSHSDKKMRETMEMLIRRKASVFLMIYPEGTRYNPNRKDVLKKSQDYAAKLGLKQLHHVLTPRVKAFDTALKSLQNYVDAVYDITVIYDDKDQCTASERRDSFGTIEFLNGACKRVYVKFTRIPIDDVLKSINRCQEIHSNEASASMNWLHDRFAIKDDLFKTVYRTKAEQDASDHNENSGNKKIWKRSSLSLCETFPAFLLAIIFFCSLYFPIVRLFCILTVTVGTAFELFYCHFYA